MACRVDRARVDRGLRPLTTRVVLEVSSGYKLSRIIYCGGLPEHTPCGDSVLRPFYQAGYLPDGKNWNAGECLAWGFGSTREAFRALMNSPPHRKVILTPRMRDFGLSRAATTENGLVWVLHFGYRSSGTAGIGHVHEGGASSVFLEPAFRGVPPSLPEGTSA